MKRSSTWIIIVAAVVILGLMLTVAYLVWWKPQPQVTNNKQSTVTSFDTCTAAGNAVRETSPRTCQDTITGVVYTEQAKTQNPPATTTPTMRSFTSEHGVSIQLDNWVDDMNVSSPFTVTGRVPGNWSFEATFPMELTNSSGAVIAQTPARLTGDWMTTDMVPFTATLTFDPQTANSTGSLILHKDNPSGQAQNDDSLTIKIHY